jgi:rod shape-determining protein MreD
MIRFLLLLAFGFLCIIIQSNTFLNYYIFPIKPDLTIPLTLYVSLYLPPLHGALLVVGIAYLVDATSGGLLGLYMFLRTTLYLIIHLMKGQITLDNRFYFLIAVIILFFLESFLARGLFHFMGINIGTAQKLLTNVLYQGIFTVVLWVIIAPLLTKLEQVAKRFRGF